MRCSRSSVGSARSSSTRSRSPDAATTSCCTRAWRTTTRPGATSSTSAARSSRRTTRDSPSSRRASSRGSAGRGARTRRASSPRTPRWLSACSSAIRAEGPLSSLDFERERGTTTDWFGMPTNTVRAVLEAYSVTGVLGLARRDGNRRYYDLLERLLPANVARAARSRSRSNSATSSSRGTALTASSASVEAETSSAGSARRSRTRRGLVTLAERLYARSSSPTGELVPFEVERCAGSGSFSGRRSRSWKRPRSRRPPSHSCPRSIRWSGTGLSSDRSSTSTTCGSSSSRRPSGAGAGTCCRCSSATASSAGSSRASTAPGPGAGARPLVGGRLRAAPHRGLRRRDARRAPRLPALRRRDPPRVGAAPRNGETAVSHAPLERLLAVFRSSNGISQSRTAAGG